MVVSAAVRPTGGGQRDEGGSRALGLLSKLCLAQVPDEVVTSQLCSASQEVGEEQEEREGGVGMEGVHPVFSLCSMKTSSSGQQQLQTLKARLSPPSPAHPEKKSINI